MTAQNLKNDLALFTGTEQYFKHWLGFNYTDGVKYLSGKAECYWLLDAIGSYQYKFKRVPFQVWILKVNADKTAVLEMKEDTNQPLLVRQEIPYTDFPLTEIKLYLIDGVLILPSEY